MDRRTAIEIAARALEIVDVRDMEDHGYEAAEVDEAIATLAND